jgi:hypothetical protein
MCFDYGRCDRKLLYAACKDWTGMGGTKFPLKHKASAKRLRSRGAEGKVRTYDMGGKDSTLDAAKAIADYASS